MSIYNAVYSTENELIQGGECKFAVASIIIISIAVLALRSLL